MELGADVVAWVETVAGGTVVAVEHQGRWRPHFFVDIERPDGEKVPLLVRFPRDPELVAESAFLSHFDIAHEARVLETISGRGLNIPLYYGFNPAVPAILMGRVEGTNDLSDLDDEVRGSVIREYFENLLALHSIPVDESVARTIGLEIPRTAEGLAHAKFEYMESDYRRDEKRLRPEPLLDFALWWLHENVPTHRTRPALVQGDTGPGQFMVHDGRLTSLIDWEMCHIGDPLLDLGQMRMRNMIYPIGNLNEHLDYYSELKGEPLDRDVLCYYTVLSMVLSPLGMAVTIQDPDPSVGSMMPRFGWDVTLRRGLCDALCEAYGVEVDAPAMPTAALEPSRSDLHRFLVGDLEQLCVPIAHDEYERFLLIGALGVARAVEVHHRIGGQVDSDDLDDMARVLGRAPSDREAGLEALAALVATNGRRRALDLLWLFSRMERRRERLWDPLMISQKSRPFERRFPAEGHLDGPSERVV